MRVAVVAGPDPGHAFPAIALCLKLGQAGDEPTLLTGTEWVDTALAAGVDAVELLGLDPTEGDDDGDAGAKIHQRAARMAACQRVADPRSGRGTRRIRCHHRVRRHGGGAARTAVGGTVPASALSAVEGAAAGGQRSGPWHRGPGPTARRGLMRALTARSIRQGERQRSAARVGIGLPAHDPGPVRRLIATLPAWKFPGRTGPTRPSSWDPCISSPRPQVLVPPPGEGPLIVVAPSTATTGARGTGRTRARLSGAGGDAAGGCPAGGVPDGRRGSDAAAVGGRRAGPPGRAARATPI